ncbi:hypothetical protein DL95DRAFT_527478 [Leptodontidium sp. 2 PMI_412]|nr:hypothetical protein DL95DRAFT_527478 [Leptodontidium sp. 2 PMI_412]
MVGLIQLPTEVLVEIILWAFLIPAKPGRSGQYERIDTKAPLTVGMTPLLRTHSISKILTKSFAASIDSIHDYKAPDFWKLCDLYTASMEHRCKRWALLDLALACKRLHELTEPFIWGLLEMDQSVETSVRDVMRLLDTISQKPQLGCHVKAFAFRHYYFDKFEGSELSPATNSLIAGWDETEKLAYLLDKLPNLQSLKFSIATEEDYWDVFKPAHIYPSGFPLGLQNLTEVILLCEDYDDDGIISGSMLLPLFLLPSIKTLYVGLPVVVAGEKCIPDDISQYFGKSKVTDLILEFGLLEMPDPFLKLPAALESFTYSVGVGSNRCGNACIGEYYQALLPQRKSLKKIKIRSVFDRDRDEEDLPRGVIKRFQALEELSTPARHLVLKPESDFGGLQSVLPSALERLVLYAYDDWRIDELEKVLRPFLELGKEACPRLKSIFVLYWLDPDYVRESGDDKDIVVEEVQSVFQSLSELGNKVGVEVVFDLDSDSTSSHFWS